MRKQRRRGFRPDRPNGPVNIPYSVNDKKLRVVAKSPDALNYSIAELSTTQRRRLTKRSRSSRDERITFYFRRFGSAYIYI